MSATSKSVPSRKTVHSKRAASVNASGGRSKKPLRHVNRDEDFDYDSEENLSHNIDMEKPQVINATADISPDLIHQLCSEVSYLRNEIAKMRDSHASQIEALTSQFTTLSQMHSSLLNKMTDLINSNASIENNSSKLSQAIDSLEAKGQALPEPAPWSFAAIAKKHLPAEAASKVVQMETTNAFQKEEIERKKRELNLILVNATPELAKEVLIKLEVSIPEEKMFALRDGKDGTKRFLVTVSQHRDKLMLLSKAKILRADDKFKNVFIREDLTPAEAQVQFVKRQQARALNAELKDDKWVIYARNLVLQSKLKKQN